MSSNWLFDKPIYVPYKSTTPNIRLQLISQESELKKIVSSNCKFVHEGINSGAVDYLDDKTAERSIQYFRDSGRSLLKPSDHEDPHHTSKLCLEYLASNFAILIKTKSPELILQRSFTDNAEEYLNHFAIVVESVDEFVSNWFEDHVITDPQLKVKTKKVIHNLVNISYLFTITFPGLKKNLGGMKSSGTITSFGKYIVSGQSLQDYSVAEPKSMPSPTELDMEAAQALEVTNDTLIKGVIRRPIMSVDDLELQEASVSALLESMYLQPTIDFLKLRFEDLQLKLKRQTPGTNKLRPDFSLTFLFKDKSYTIPIEIKKNGIKESLENIESTKSFINLFNQSIHQMVDNNSAIAFIIDCEYLVVISVTHPELTKQNLEGDKYVKSTIDCDTQVFDHHGNHNLGFLLCCLLTNYLSKLDEAVLNIGIDFSNKLLVESEVVSSLKEMWYEEVRNDWNSCFQSTTYNIKQKLYLTEKGVKISRTLFGLIQQNEVQFSQIGKSDKFQVDKLGIKRNESDHDNSEYLSQVRRVKFKNETYFLKLYDPIQTFKIRGSVPRDTFEKTYSFSLGMFLTELQVFRMINGNLPNIENFEQAIKTRTAHKNDFNYSFPKGRRNEKKAAMKFIPELYSYGYLQLPGHEGFYLLESFIKDCLFSIKNEEELEEFIKLAEKGMDVFHKSGTAHGDIHADNIMFTYDAKGNKAVKFFDFGQSKMNNYDTLHDMDGDNELKAAILKDKARLGDALNELKNRWKIHQDSQKKESQIIDPSELSPVEGGSWQKNPNDVSAIVSPSRREIESRSDQEPSTGTTLTTDESNTRGQTASLPRGRKRTKHR
ncbi:uncharacterized protein RJT21DRAFT_111445 [Scheffersomyces amazonensis]|uniref:uncharacterized protein n=1 Tax=Scheffersomyces amazonensis TaxID=1078765 RepID=UPI00315CB64F